MGLILKKTKTHIHIHIYYSCSSIRKYLLQQINTSLHKILLKYYDGARHRGGYEEKHNILHIFSCQRTTFNNNNNKYA